MGIGPSSRCRSFAPSGAPAMPPNPNPRLFTIEHLVGYALKDGIVVSIVQIQYIGVTNYEGRKLMLLPCEPHDVAEALAIDPHFDEKKGPLVPLARFEPTPLGWAMAIAVVDSYRSGKIMKDAAQHTEMPMWHGYRKRRKPND